MRFCLDKIEPMTQGITYERIWQMQALDAKNIIAVHIRHVREKIEKNPKEPKYITVVRGLGYKVG